MDIAILGYRPDIRAILAVAKEVDMMSVLLTRAADATVLSVSPQTAEFLGYSAPELVGRSPLDLIHPSDAARARQEHDEVKSGGRASADYLVHHRQGHNVAVRRVSWLSGGDVVVSVMVPARQR